MRTKFLYSVIIVCITNLMSGQMPDTVVPTINYDCVIGHINLYGANFSLGPDCVTYSGANSCPSGSGPVNGVSNFWRGPNAVTWLVERLQEFYDAGVRKIMMNRPMGNSGWSYVPGGAWNTIPQYKRDSMVTQLKPWLQEHPDVTFGIFIGSRWLTLDTLVGYHEGMGPYPGITNGFDPQIPFELAAWHQVFDPWYDIGVRWVLLDAGAQPANRDWFLRLAKYEKDQRNVEVTAEAITNSVPHHKQASWIAKAPEFIEHPNRPFAQLGPVALDTSAKTTWYAWLHLNDLEEVYNNGYVSTNDPAQYIQTLINRKYSIITSYNDLMNYPALTNLLNNCSIGTGVSSHKISANELYISPNPLRTQATISSDIPFKNATLTVYNTLGEVVKQAEDLSGQEVIIQRGDLPAGLYFIYFKQNNEILVSDKLIIAD